MSIEQVIQLSKTGINTLLSSVLFFYGHVVLVLISLIPALFRAYQMWHHLHTPIWLEIVVELTRVVLFMLILAKLLGTDVNGLSQKSTWDKLRARSSDHWKRNWPGVFMAQLVVFIVILFGIVNIVILITANILQGPVMDLLGSQDSEAAHNTVVFFLKNMTVIPLSLVFILRMCGISSIDDEGLGHIRE